MPSRKEILQKIGKATVNGIAAASTILGRDGARDPTPAYIPHVSTKEAGEHLAKVEQADRNKKQSERLRDSPVKGKGRGRRKPENPSQGRTTPRNAPRQRQEPKYEDFTNNREGKRAARREAGFVPEPASRANGGRPQAESRSTRDQRGQQTPQATRGRPGERRFSNDTGGRRQAPQRRQEPPPPFSTPPSKANGTPSHRGGPSSRPPHHCPAWTRGELGGLGLPSGFGAGPPAGRPLLTILIILRART
jgi:hypothetical protein